MHELATVYLAGPISRVSYRAATEWRDDACQILNDLGIAVLNPMDDKTPPAGGEDVIIDQGDQLGFTAQEVFDRDMGDIDESDILLVNMGDFTGSIGTPFEIGRAWSEGRTVVVYNAEKWMSHPFSAAFDYVAPNLKEAIDIINAIVAQVNANPGDVVAHY